MTPRIFLVCFPAQGWAPTDVLGFAVAEDGTGLCSHLSSSEEWSKHDLGFTSDWRKEIYQRHYPDGYVLEWVDDPDNNPDYQAALVLNQKLNEHYDDIADAEREAKFGKGL
jgi:hypothetical protein